MEAILTLAIPFCALVAPCNGLAVPLSPAVIHFGQCLDLIPRRSSCRAAKVATRRCAAVICPE